MDIENQQAFVLHSRPFKEHQVILDLLTEYDGKVSAVVSPGSSLKSSKKAFLQPFYPLNVAFKGNNALKKITFIEPAGKSFQYFGNTLYSGFYLNELLVRLLVELVPCPQLFLHYKVSLIGLSEGKELEQVLRAFEFALLDELGLTLDFESLSETATKYFHFVHEQGFVPADRESGVAYYDRNHLLAIAMQDFTDPKVKITCKRLMRQIMAPLLGNKPLNSRKLFTQKPFS